MIIAFIIIAVLIAACVVAYFTLKKKGLIDLIANRMKVKRVDVATVDGECRFIDCVAWFKNLKLNKEADIPFVLDYTKFQDKFAGGEFKVPVTKPCAVLLGVYNEKSDEMPNMQIIQCDKFDEKLVETLGAAENGLVVLS